MGFILSRRSLKNLECVHEDLVKVVQRALEITEVDFTVIEGVRSYEKQAQLLKTGATRTMNSRHLTGHAVDLAAWVNGKINWTWSYYCDIAEAMKTAAKELGVSVEWGGDWVTFKDGPHFQLSWKEYPK